MSLIPMELSNAFSAREFTKSQSLLKNSIHKLSSGTRLVKSRNDSGMLSLKMKMDAEKYKNVSSISKIGSSVSFLDMQDGMLNNAQNILIRMSELKGLSINDPLKSEQDLDAYNNEFHDLQRQLYQLSKTTFNKSSLFANTTQIIGGEEVRYNGTEQERNSMSIATISSTISIEKLPFLAALTIRPDNARLPIDQPLYGTGFDSNGVGVINGNPDGNWFNEDGAGAIVSNKYLRNWGDTASTENEFYTEFDLSDYKNILDISFNLDTPSTVEESQILVNEKVIHNTDANSSYQYFDTSVKTSTGIYISDIMNDGLNELKIIAMGGVFQNQNIKVDNFNIRAVPKEDKQPGIGFSDRLDNNGTIALGIELEVSLANISEVPMYFFNRAIENLSDLRAHVNSTKSRFNFSQDLIQNLNSLSKSANARLADVDYASEIAHMAKQKIKTSASTAMVTHANNMGDVVLIMLK